LRAGRSAATSPLPSVAGRRPAASFPLLSPRILDDSALKGAIRPDGALPPRHRSEPRNFAYWAGENLDLRGLEDDGTPLLERAVALRPSRYYSYRLAWALTRHGDSARAIDILTAASHRYPDAWEFPFLLGYHYARTGRYVEAIAALERVETLRPGVPDVDRVLAQLRQRERPALP